MRIGAPGGAEADGPAVELQATQPDAAVANGGPYRPIGGSSDSATLLIVSIGAVTNFSGFAWLAPPLRHIHTCLSATSPLPNERLLFSPVGTSRLRCRSVQWGADWHRCPTPRFASPMLHATCISYSSAFLENPIALTHPQDIVLLWCRLAPGPFPCKSLYSSADYYIPIFSATCNIFCAYKIF